jgi:hypothetical protein
MLASEWSNFKVLPEACFDVYLAVNTVSIVATKLKKLRKLIAFSNSGFGNIFPDQPITSERFLVPYLIRELYLNAGLG